MDADVKRDLVRKTILMQIKIGFVNYTSILDSVTAKSKDFASSNTIKKQFYKYLIPQNYIERVSLGKYKLTQKGEKFLDLLLQKT